jgi:hypothetical protein
LGDVTLRLGERRLEITISEAKLIQQRAVESRLAAAKLHSALRGAVRIYPGRIEEIVIAEDMRRELLLDLNAIEDTQPLSAGLQDLREAAETSIVTEPPGSDTLASPTAETVTQLRTPADAPATPTLPPDRRR